MTQAPANSGRFEALDALRGICALLVVLFHIPIYHALKDVRSFGNLQLCVDLFFALSGFVLYHAYGQRLASGADALRFLVRRFLRLWPLHVAVLGLLVLLDLAKLGYGHANAAFSMDAQPFTQGHSVGEIVTNLLFLQSFGLHPGMSWNGPAWSAAVEFYVSILFASVVLLFPARHRIVFLGLSVVAGLALYAVSPDSLFVSTDWGALRAILGFFAGCLVCAARTGSPGRLRRASVLEAACLAALVGFAAFVPSGGWQFLFVPMVCGLIYVFSFDSGALSAVLRMRWLQAIGLWSYSIYMVHAFLFQLLKTAASFVSQKTGLVLVAWHNNEKLVLIGSPEQAVLPAVILSIVLVVPVAALTYRWIEKPAMSLPERKTMRQRFRARLRAIEAPLPAAAA